MADETWHVSLFHVHPDGTATQYAWWVDPKYATDMLGYMGEPDGESLMSVADVEASKAAAAGEAWLFREEPR